MNKISLFILILILSITPALADYNSWHESGGTGNTYFVRGTFAQNFTEVEPPSSTSGSVTHPIVADLNNDGTNEIMLYAGNNIISILDGDDPTEEQNAIAPGEPFISPVACDIDQDGSLEYVGVFNNGTNNLVATSLSSSGDVSIVSTVIANQTNLYGRMECARFYQPQGDTKNYVLFADESRFLHIAHVTGGAWVDTIIDVGAVAEEDGEAQVFERKNDVVFSDNFHTGGENTVALVGGKVLYTYHSDGSLNDFDFSSEFSTAPAAGSTSDDKISLHVMPQSSGADRIFIGSTGDAVHGVKVRYVGGTLFQDDSVIFYSGGGLDVLRDFFWMVGPWEQSSRYDIVVVGTEVTTGPNTFYARVYAGSDHSLQFSASNDSLGDRVFYSYLVDTDNDADNDVLYFPDFGSGNTSKGIISYLGPNLSQRPTILQFPDADYQFLYTPVPVDYNNDGLLDMIYTSGNKSIFFQSSVESQTVEDFPFTLAFSSAQNESGVLSSTVDVTAGYDPERDGYTYNFAAVCSVLTTSIWNERFTTGYNFTQNDVQTNPSGLESSLTFQGLSFTIGGNFSSLDITKFHDEGIRQNMEVTLSVTPGENRTFDVLSFAENDFVTSYFRFNKTGTTVTVEQVVPFAATIPLGSTTVSGTQFQYKMTYAPVRSEFSGLEYFTVEVFVNNVSINTTSTVFENTPGSDIKDVSVFTEDDGSFIVHSLGLAGTTDFEPSFVQFQNGQQFTNNGVTFTINATSSSFAGDGFTVIPGHNEEFSYECVYDQPGTYVQRAYLAPVNTADDYTNYKEITVVIPSDLTSDDTPGTGTDFEDDETLGLIDAFLESIGLGSDLAKFLIAWVFILGMTFFGTQYHIIAGVLSFLVGLVVFVSIGWISLWIVLVLVIFAAAILVLAFKKVFGGT